MHRQLFAISFVSLLSCSPFGSASGAPDAVEGGASSGDASSGGTSGGGTTASPPEILVAGLTNPRLVVPTSGGLFWTSTLRVEAGTQEGLQRCALDGCKGAQAEVLGPVRGLGASNGEVFWSTSDAIYVCASGAPCAPRLVRSGLTSAMHVTGQGGALFFTAMASGKTTLFSCDPASCGAPAEIWSGSAVHHLLATGADLLWISGDVPPRLWRRSDPSVGIALVSGLVVAVGTIGTRVYFVKSDDATLYTCDAVTSCSPVPFVTGEQPINFVTVHRDAIYYGTFAKPGVPGLIKRCNAVDDCAAPTLIASEVNPRRLIGADEWLYFADWGDERAGGGSIRRVRLPD